MTGDFGGITDLMLMIENIVDKLGNVDQIVNFVNFQLKVIGVVHAGHHNICYTNKQEILYKIELQLAGS